MVQRGGVWADASEYCIQPLDAWLWQALGESGFWMHTSCRNRQRGVPRSNIGSWFMATSGPQLYIPRAWLAFTLAYWRGSNGNSDCSDTRCNHWYFWMDDLFTLLYAIDGRVRKTYWSTPACVHPSRSADFIEGISWAPFRQQGVRAALLTDPPYFLKLSYKSPPPHTPTCVERATRCAEGQTVDACLQSASEECPLAAQTPAGVVFLAGKLGVLPSRPVVHHPVESHPTEQRLCLRSACLCKDDAECRLKATSCSNTSRHCIPYEAAAAIVGAL